MTKSRDDEGRFTEEEPNFWEKGHLPLSSEDERGGGLAGLIGGAFLGGAVTLLFSSISAVVAGIFIIGGALIGWKAGESLDD